MCVHSTRIFLVQMNPRAFIDKHFQKHKSLGVVRLSIQIILLSLSKMKQHLTPENSEVKEKMLSKQQVLFNHPQMDIPLKIQLSYNNILIKPLIFLYHIETKCMTLIFDDEFLLRIHEKV